MPRIYFLLSTLQNTVYLYNNGRFGGVNIAGTFSEHSTGKHTVLIVSSVYDPDLPIPFEASYFFCLNTHPTMEAFYDDS